MVQYVLPCSTLKSVIFLSFRLSLTFNIVRDPNCSIFPYTLHLAIGKMREKYLGRTAPPNSDMAGLSNQTFPPKGEFLIFKWWVFKIKECFPRVAKFWWTVLPYQHGDIMGLSYLNFCQDVDPRITSSSSCRKIHTAKFSSCNFNGKCTFPTNVSYKLTQKKFAFLDNYLCLCWQTNADQEPVNLKYCSFLL